MISMDLTIAASWLCCFVGLGAEMGDEVLAQSEPPCVLQLGTPDEVSGFG